MQQPNRHQRPGQVHLGRLRQPFGPGHLPRPQLGVPPAHRLALPSRTASRNTAVRSVGSGGSAGFPVSVAVRLLGGFGWP